MRNLFIYIGIFCFGFMANAQVFDPEKYSDTLQKIIKKGDADAFIELPEMIIEFSKEEMDRIRTMRVLERRILRVYPYVVAASENLVHINQELDKLPTERAKSQYIKSQEKILEKKFKDPLKKLSRKDGQILIKLIHRQTGITTYHLVKDLKSGWTAFWSNQTAKLFDLNLKQTYNPNDNIEDFYIETLINDLANARKINYVAPVMQYNKAKLDDIWRKRLGTSGFFPE